jgi:hypothetical protein
MLQDESMKQSGVLAQYVDAQKLLEILFAPECRPSIRWLREQQAERKIPFVKLGRLVFFDPVVCKAVFDARAMKGKVAA